MEALRPLTWIRLLRCIYPSRVGGWHVPHFADCETWLVNSLPEYTLTLSLLFITTHLHTKTNTTGEGGRASLLRFSACLWCAFADQCVLRAPAPRRGGEKGIGTRQSLISWPDLIFWFFYLFDRESCAQTETHTHTYIHILIYKKINKIKTPKKKGHLLSRKKKGRCSSPLLCLCVHVPDSWGWSRGTRRIWRGTREQGKSRGALPPLRPSPVAGGAFSVNPMTVMMVSLW